MLQFAMDRRKLLRAVGGSLAIPAFGKGIAATPSKPNFLFISIDDLNDWISPLSSSSGLGAGYPGVITPALQGLADQGANLTSAYAAVPACGPSRAAVISGAAPWRSGIYFNGQPWRSGLKPDQSTLFQYFRAYGYNVAGCGKIFHGDNGLDQFDHQFSQNAQECDNTNPKKDFFPSRNQARKYSFGVSDGNCHWSNEFDNRNSQLASQYISEKFGSGGNLLAVGLIGTHLPFIVDPSVLELYHDVAIDLPPGFSKKRGIPVSPWYREAMRDLQDISKYGSKFKKNVSIIKNNSKSEYLEIIKYYLCCITLIDQHIGNLIKAVQSNEVIANNTYVVVWSDHGFHMAEKLSFAKFTLWERSLRVPFLIVGPDIPQAKIDTPVSLLDIFPTMCALANVPIPSWSDGVALDGQIFNQDSIHRDHTISVASPSSRNIPKKEDQRISVRVASQDWNYIKHPDGSQELYDRHKDPHEWDNLLHSEPYNRRILKAQQAMQSLIPETRADPVL